MSRIRRFGGQPFRLIDRIYHYDKHGRSRTPAATKYAAEKRAEEIRAAGFNARVVNWVGGSGIFVAPSRRRYLRTLAEARKAWLSEVQQRNYDSAAFGGFNPLTNDIGDNIAEAEGVKIDHQEEKQNYQNLRVLNDADDVMASIIAREDLGVVPVSSNTEYGPFLFDKMLNEATESGGIPGWGPIEFESEIESENKVPMPMNIYPDPDNPGQAYSGGIRRRYRVAISFKKDDLFDEYGEMPTYAFATKKEAELFQQKLREKIDNQGYYFQGGANFMSEQGDVIKREKGIYVPSTNIEIDVVEEKSGWIEDAMERKNVLTFAQQPISIAKGLNPPNLNRKLFEDLNLDVQELKDGEWI